MQRPCPTISSRSSAVCSSSSSYLSSHLLVSPAPRRPTTRLRAAPVQQESSQQTPQQKQQQETIRIGTRGSQLARLQGEMVQQLLTKVRPEWGPDAFSFEAVETHGDAAGAAPLRELGQGAFTDNIDRGVAEGRLDLAVHSLKDAPVRLPDGVALAACLPRDDPRDALISKTARSLAELPAGARVGTSSMRRKAQLLHAHPHLTVVPVRGNIESRLQQIESGQLDAIVLAAAGLSRLGQPSASSLITRVLGFDEMLPAACQGAIGAVCAASDDLLRIELGLICHEPTRLEVAAERALLAALLLPPQQQEDAAQQQQQPAPAARGPPTSAPSLRGISAITGLPMLPGFAVACHAAFDPHEGLLRLEGLVASEDGRSLHRLAAAEGASSPAEAEAIGAAMGAQLRAVAEQHGWLPDEQ